MRLEYKWIGRICSNPPCHRTGKCPHVVQTQAPVSRRLQCRLDHVLHYVYRKIREKIVMRERHH